MTNEVVQVLDNCQISNRKAVQIIAAVAHSLGHNRNDLILNPNSFRKKREKLREEEALHIKELFNTEDIDFVTIHWDVKLLPVPQNNLIKKDRVAIFVTSGDLAQILDVPELDRGTGALQGKSDMQCS